MRDYLLGMKVKKMVLTSLNEISILDVGCGSSKTFGSIGIDCLPLKGVDIVHDLNIFPWPLKDESFERIIFSHSISHLNNVIDVIIECNRLLRPGGYLEVVAPHYSSDNFNTDPTHRFPLGSRSMNYFVDNVEFGYRYINPNIHFELVCSSLSFRECHASWRKNLKPNLLKWIGLELLVNRFPRFYERFFCWVLPTSEVYFLMKKTSESNDLS